MTVLLQKIVEMVDAKTPMKLPPKRGKRGTPEISPKAIGIHLSFKVCLVAGLGLGD